MHNPCNNGNQVVWASEARIEPIFVLAGYSSKSVKLGGLFTSKFEQAGQGTCGQMQYSLTESNSFAKVAGLEFVVDSQEVSEVGNYTVTMTVGLTGYPLCTPLRFEVPVSILAVKWPVREECKGNPVAVIVLAIVAFGFLISGVFAGRKYEAHIQKRCTNITPKESDHSDFDSKPPDIPPLEMGQQSGPASPIQRMASRGSNPASPVEVKCLPSAEDSPLPDKKPRLTIGRWNQLKPDPKIDPRVVEADSPDQKLPSPMDITSVQESSLQEEPA